MSWALLGFGLGAATLTIPAVRPVRVWLVLFPAFVVSLVTAELPGWCLAVTVAGAGALAGWGGLAGGAGWVGLAASGVAAGGLIRQIVLARRAAPVVDENLGALDGLHRPPPRRSATDRLNPFRLGDRDVVRVDEVRYAPGAGRRHLLDVYRARSATSGAPVLLQIHGGAWISGGKRTQGRLLVNRLARAGWVCVANNYQLSPAVKHPEHLVDCKRALAWIREHIAEYGGDPTRVVVTGGSAGGHLAALVALTANDPAFQPGFESVDTSVLACVSMYGAYSLTELFAGTGRARRIAAWMGRLVAGVDVATARHVFDQASPLQAVHRGAPPFLIMHGTVDNLVPVEQARRFVLALRALVPDTVVYVELPGAPHAFDVVRSVRTTAALAGAERFVSWVLDAEPGRNATPAAGTARSGPTTTARTGPSSNPRGRAAPSRS
jgi:acetyl esterase/lipase